MRHWLCALSAAAVLVSGSALAADLGKPPVAPAPPPPPAFTWTGPYVGVHIGYASGGESDNLSYYDQIPADSFDAYGVLGGGQIGYNWQVNQLVLGVEADVDASGVRGSSDWAANSSSLKMTNDWQASVRARAGYAIDRTLLYVTGGVAFADDKETLTTPSYPVGSQTQTLTGWTIGGGLDQAFSNNWIGRIEARYSDFGKADYDLDNYYRFKAGFHETTVLVGLSYLFGAPPPPPPPVAARY